MRKSTPPSYEQSTGPNLPILGTPEDLEKAQEVAGPGSRVYAALRVSEDAISRLSFAQLKVVLLIPCLWPSLICIGPVLCASGFHIKARLKNMLYIITADRVITFVADHSPPCNCCATTGNDSGEFELDKIVDVIVDNKGKGCNFIKTASVRIGLPTGNIFLLVDNPTEIAELIRNLRKFRAEAKSKSVVIQQPYHVNPHSSETKRIFVASATVPTDFKVVHLQGDTVEDWNDFINGIKHEFSLDSKTHLSFLLPELQAPVTSAAEVNGDDRIMFTVSNLV